jgi:hypothetical protein
MAKHRTTVDTEIARRLDDTPTPGSPNRITAQQLKEWAVEYLREYDDELVQFPEFSGQSHWNLWMMDARYEDALFAVLIFQAEGVVFFCGTGNAFQVKEFAESHMADRPHDVLAEMSERFSTPLGCFRLDRKAAEQWLGRTW